MIKNVLAAIATTGLMIAPVAAQAGTRAADAGVSLGGLASADRVGATIGDAEGNAGHEVDGGLPIWIVIAGLLLIGGGIIAAVESGASDRSPGT